MTLAIFTTEKTMKIVEILKEILIFLFYSTNPLKCCAMGLITITLETFSGVSGKYE